MKRRVNYLKDWMWWHNYIAEVLVATVAKKSTHKQLDLQGRPGTSQSRFKYTKPDSILL